MFASFAEPVLFVLLAPGTTQQSFSISKLNKRRKKRKKVETVNLNISWVLNDLNSQTEIQHTFVLYPDSLQDSEESGVKSNDNNNNNLFLKPLLYQMLIKPLPLCQVCSFNLNPTRLPNKRVFVAKWAPQHITSFLFSVMPKPISNFLPFNTQHQ